VLEETFGAQGIEQVRFINLKVISPAYVNSPGIWVHHISVYSSPTICNLLIQHLRSYRLAMCTIGAQGFG